MLSRDNIIGFAWLKIGEQNNLYNSNTTERNRIAELLLDKIIRNLAADTSFLFNSRKIALEKNSNDKNDFGENRFNIPVDFLNKIQISDRNARFEHEFIYSTSDSVDLTYCYDIQFTEIPMYMENYITISLALALAESYDSFNSKIPYLREELLREQIRVLNMEGLPYSIPR